MAKKWLSPYGLEAEPPNLSEGPGDLTIRIPDLPYLLLKYHIKRMSMLYQCRRT